jgi:hypothetical protein
MNQRIFKTAQGTELPLLNLRGKEYLEVKYRLVWFREEHPQWSIETEFLNVTERSAFARAVVRDETGRVIATSHKAEAVDSFPDFMEKAETGAIGRALALIGFGTQFCADELDEGDRIVDAPASAPAPRSQSVAPVPRSNGSAGSAVPGVRNALSSAPALPSSRKPFDLGEFQVNFGRKYLGKRLKDIPKDEIIGYVKWLEEKAAEKKKGPDIHVTLLKDAVDRFHNPEKYAKKRDGSENQDKQTEEAAAAAGAEKSAGAAS